MIVFVLVTSTFSTVSAKNLKGEEKTVFSNGYKMTLIKKTDNYEKNKIQNLETKEVEFLEYFPKNGGYKASTKNGEYTINSLKDNSVKIVNNDTNETRIIKPEPINDSIKKNEFEKKMNQAELQESELNSNGTIGTLGLYDDMPANTDWKFSDHWTGSADADVSTFSVLVGTIASLLGTPAWASIAFSWATYIAGQNVDKIYYSTYLYTRIKDYDFWHKRVVYSYKYWDHTGYLGYRSYDYKFY